MSTVVLLGHPVAHSLSAAMQNAAFAAAGLEHRYEARDVRPEDLRAAVTRLREDDAVLGANVTIPHKEAVTGLVDGHDADALRLGVVNTISKHRDAQGRPRLQGWNTDGAGFTRALGDAGIGLAGKRVLVLGAGGASRAVTAALVAALARVTIANRTRTRAERLARTFPTAGGAWRPEVVDWLPPWALAGADIVVNATALGLQGEDPLAGIALPPRLTVVDLIPVAADTPLVARARAVGCEVLGGLPMLVHQGALAFAIWTGTAAPIAAMRHAVGLH